MKKKLKPSIAHSLIGKYIYIRYLRDRNILSDKWLLENNINIDGVLGRNANVSELEKLIDTLERRFNGKVFPLPLRGEDAPDDELVSLVASVFKGDDPVSGQLALDFSIYNFSFIPIELLSSIYEQFLHEQGQGKCIGAYYTPEPVANYLISELNSFNPINENTKILDPCCGSGIFLVLTYRRLIELNLHNKNKSKLQPIELRSILEDNVYGVERNIEACYVTEFSLILTLLSYIEPPDLHINDDFKFPILHNQNIFYCDFFDDNSLFKKKNIHFDWIIGNPPWLEIDSKNDLHKLAFKWINSLSREFPVARYRLCEAFSWRVTNFLNLDGYVGLFMHATSLTNDQSEVFRKAFFKKHEVMRITNFSNLAYQLFNKRAEAPAITIIYKCVTESHKKAPIIHYGPFAVNQILSRSQSKKYNWSITIFQNEIQSVDPIQAETGSSLIWKLALWGSYRDKKAISRLKNIFPKSLEEKCKEKNWTLCLGLQLRDGDTNQAKEKVQFEPILLQKQLLDANEMSKSGYHFTVPQTALRQVPNEKCFIRIRGGRNGLKIIQAPHLVLGSNFAAYSDIDFILPHPQIGLAVTKADTNYLRALSVFFNSSIVKYMVFFQCSSWGIDRSIIGLNEARCFPIPEFSEDQINILVELHKKFSLAEKTDSDYIYQDELDNYIEQVAIVPKSINILAREFVSIRLQFNKGKVSGFPIKNPKNDDLLNYAIFLRDSLDNFAGYNHKIIIFITKLWIACEIELTSMGQKIEPLILNSEKALGDEDYIWALLKQNHSQWVYIQRGLKIFSNSKIYLYKSSRLIDWTRTQALLDSDDIISEVLDQAGDLI